MDSTRRGRQVVISAAVVILAAAPALWGGTAAEIIQQAGVRGGLVVHVGCGDGRLTAGLGGSERYVVHGLDTDADNVRRAREHIRSLGLYGRVAADQFDGKRLPYVGELVNLLVADELGGVSMDEALRVLAPGGVACIRKGDTWGRTVKPRPADIDEWSHFLHDAGGNAVANDRRVGPPERLRWVAGPPWCRSHEFPSSVQAVVTAGGRIFTIFDEAPSGVFRKLPQQCSLIARDAFSGVLLWKAPLRQWQPEFGTGTGSRWQIHHTIPRRLVSTQDRVYVTLQFAGSPVSVLDAATGAVLVEALEGTKGTDEMVLSDGVLIVKIAKGVSVGAMERIGKDSLEDTLAAVDVGTGRQLWRQANVRVLPYALSAQAGRVVYHNMDELVCLDARSGKQLWRAPNPTGPTQGGVSTLVITDGVVLYHGNGQAVPAAAAAVAAAAIKAAEQPTATKARKKGTSQGRFFLTALSLADGKGLWRHAGKRAWAGACTQPTDLFVTNGIVWCGALEGRDLHSGEVRKKVDVGEMISPGHHYRCHRSKATERYLILPKRGAEFVDVEGDNHMRHDWLRAPCFTGLTPANGLLYVPPSPCFCYPGAKVSGFLAMSAEPAEKLTPATDAHLHRGLAYGKVEPSSPMGNRKSETANVDWPCYRHDTLRSGSTTAAVPAELTRRWEIDLACRGTQPVIVGERLWVAEKDAHRIRCLSAGTGKDLWSFT
ncbi:MAG TPA: PQQ-binding-like beta-propeller repeat protein, partial [Phycisphaerae bacterium]|nr:PQQ-binding-like beta-propeller repeat protein [Phycisphaerae bacterium]